MTQPRQSTPAAWEPGPAHPHLADNAVHVWRAELDSVSTQLTQLLSAAERARAERIVDPRTARLWAHARGLLRALLGRYLQRDPRSLRFVLGVHGKPALAEEAHAAGVGPGRGPAPWNRAGAGNEPGPGRGAGPAPPTRLSFNMSHSGALALYAFSSAGQVGVDVETARRPVDELAIAARALGEREAERLRKLDPVRRRREFLRAWVRHEATLKCLGLGIGAEAPVADERAPLVIELDTGANSAGALAGSSAWEEMRCWQWRA